MNVNGVDAFQTSETLTPTALEAGATEVPSCHLLVLQLQNQDALEPLNDQEFIAQLAQFSSLEQLERMAQSLRTVVDLLQEQATPAQDQTRS